MKSIGLLAFAVAGAVAGGVRADSVWVGEAGHPPIVTSGVKISGVEGDSLNYALESGTAKKESLAKVQQISVDGETAFNAAEAAYVGNKDDAALTGYQSALTSSSKDWIKARSAVRLIGLAKAKNKYDAEMVAFVQLVKSDPAAALANKPNKPTANTPGIEAALSSLSTGLGISTLSVQQKSALLSQQFEIYRAKNDRSNADSVLSKLNDLGATSPAEHAMLIVAQANSALDSKDYAKAATLITTNKAVITDPDLQVDALYVLAQASDGQTGPNGNADKQKDVAIAYLRAATFGEKLDDKPHVADALFRAGELEEAMKDPKAAETVYQQIVDDKSLSQSPSAARAKDAIARLKGGATGAAPFGVPGGTGHGHGTN